MSAEAANNPFVGLRPFESSESLLFFGRQEQTLELLQRLHQHHFVAVVGSSGSGKSSLIRAGIIPRLQAGFLVNERDRWTVLVTKPGQTPVGNLADALLAAPALAGANRDAAALAEKIKEEGVDAVLEILEPLWARNTNLFLLVDQFEELFRFSLHGADLKKKDEAKDFVNILLALVAEKELPIYVVTTMRSDFIGDCALVYGLPEAMNRSQYIVPRLTRPQLRNAIEGPVRLYNGKLNPALTSRLLNDVQLVNDELPLLQHALMRMWDYEETVQRNGELDLEDYRHIGGIEKALSIHADEALQDMTPEELNTVKKLFQALTAVDENGRKIRRPARLSELILLTGGYYKNNPLYLINRFIEGKRSFLVVSKIQNSDDYLIDISHESLIRQWKTLSDWVDEEAEYGRAFQRLAESARLYEKEQGDLLTGNELRLMWKWFAFEFQPTATWAQRYVADPEKAFAFLQKSEDQAQALWREKQKQQLQRRRNGRFLLAGLIVVILIISGFAWAVYRNNVENKRRLVLSYWNSSQTAREKSDWLNSLHFTAEAVELSGDEEVTKKILLDEEPFLPHGSLETMFSTPDVVLGAAFAPGGQQIAVTGSDGSVRILEAETGKPVLTARHGAAVYSAGFSGNGKWLLTASYDRTARLWELSTGKLLTLPHPSVVFGAVFSPDEKQVLTDCVDGYARLWNVATGKQTDSFRHTKAEPLQEYAAALTPAVFSPDGKWIMAVTDYVTARLFDAKTKKRLASFTHNDAITATAFSKDGTKILTASKDSTAQVWDAVTKQSIAKLKNTDLIHAAAFSPDGRWVVTADNAGYAQLWDAATGQRMGTAFRHEGPLYNVDFTADGKRLFTTGWDKVVRVWQMPATTPVAGEVLYRHGSVVNTAAFNAGERSIVSAGNDSTARIWNTITKKQTGALPHPDAVTGAAFSPNGERVLTICKDDIVRIWEAATGIQKDSFVVDAPIAGANFSPDGEMILIADERKRVYILNAKSLQRIDSFTYKTDVLSIHLSRDEKTLLVAGWDSAAALLDLRSKKQLAVFKHRDVVRSAAFSPNGNNVATGSDDFTARLWSIATKQQIGPVMKHEAGVKTVAFSADGGWMVTTSWDNTLRIWDVATLKQIGAPMIQKDGFNTAVFTPDGTQILTAGGDGSVRLREIGSDLDIPSDLFKLQAKALSGTALNTLTGETQCLSLEEWKPLNKSYHEKGREHYRNCKYPAYNLWRRFYAAEAKTARPEGKSFRE